VHFIKGQAKQYNRKNMTTPNTENIYHVFFRELEGPLPLHRLAKERLQCSPQQPLHTFFTALLLSTPYLGDLDPSFHGEAVIGVQLVLHKRVAPAICSRLKVKIRFSGGLDL